MTDEIKRGPGRPPKAKAEAEAGPGLRLTVAATILAGIAGQGSGRIRERDMVDSALTLADMLIELS